MDLFDKIKGSMSNKPTPKPKPALKPGQDPNIWDNYEENPSSSTTPKRVDQAPTTETPPPPSAPRQGLSESHSNRGTPPPPGAQMMFQYDTHSPMQTAYGMAPPGMYMPPPPPPGLYGMAAKTYYYVPESSEPPPPPPPMREESPPPPPPKGPKPKEEPLGKEEPRIEESPRKEEPRRDEPRREEKQRPSIAISLPCGGRIQKREISESGGPEAKRSAHDPKSSGSTSGDSFKEFSSIPVQLNSWDFDISRMDDVIEKILFKVTMIQQDGKKIELAQGLSAVSGDVNRQIRRKAQCLLFEKWFRQNAALFKDSKSSAVAAYDAAETIYVGSSNFAGGFEEHLHMLEEKDFEKEDWTVISRLSRRAGTRFEIRVKHIGHVYTAGSRALTEENRPELTRCVVTITNQVLHNKEFLLYASGTYPIEGGVLSSPDDVTEIKSGFTKVTKIVNGSSGPKAVLTVDTASSAFYKSMPLVQFMQAKIVEANGGRRGGDGGGRGGRGGRGGGFQGRQSYAGNHDGHSRRDDRYGDRRDSYGGDRRDSHRGDRRDRDRNTDPHFDYDHESIKRLERYFEDGRISASLLENLGRAMKGLDCEPIHLKNAKANRTALVDRLASTNAINTELVIERDGKTKNMSIAEYYMDKYNYKVKFPYLPLIGVKRRKEMDFFPMELLFIIPGQRIKGSQMSADIQSHMTGKNSALPLQHIAQSRTILESYLKLGDRIRNAHLVAFNVRFKSSKPICVRAKILAPPRIEFDKTTQTIDPNRGVRFQSNGKFVRPAKIRDVLVINYDSNFRSKDCGQFCESLGRFAADQGIRYEVQPRKWEIVDCHVDDTYSTRKAMERALKNKVTIVIGIVYEKRPDIHDVLKYFEELTGQQTMQITTDTARKIMNGTGGRQTIDNVLRKFNPKCGGTNFYIEVPDRIGSQAVSRDVTSLQRKLYDRTQFIGFELSHTGARTKLDQQENTFEGDPTSVGVAYSLKHSTQLGGFSYYQDTRLHKLTRLNEKLPTCLDAYQYATKRLPETIVIYRVGSGEGDYAQIAAEVQEMQDVAAQKYNGYKPKMMVILTQRHSHVRIFPEHVRGFKSVEQNVPSGTCVDNVPSAHGLDEFILCCQTPLIGTVRPTRYTIISNTAGWTKNEVMNVTYHLAFGHQVSYAPPAVPDVLYAAENLAKRGHNNFKTHTKLADMRHFTAELKKKHEIKDQEVPDDVLVNDYITSISDEINKLTINGRNFWA